MDQVRWCSTSSCRVATDHRLPALAAELGTTPAQVAPAWLLHRSPVVLPIPGTASPSHLVENGAAADLRLSDDQRARLDGIAAPEDGT